MNHERCVLFDLDGTLTDPFEGITNCVVYALEKLGRTPPPAAELKWVIGPPLLGSFETILGEPELAVEGLRLYRERFSTVGLFENEVYAGVLDALTSLKNEGRRLFVATSKPTVYTVRILDRFDLTPFFSGIYGSELDGTRTDKGALIEHLLESEALHPSSTAMVGDRSHDMLGAKVNGLNSIGVLYGYGSREELESVGATCLAESPSDVPEAIASLFPS